MKLKRVFTSLLAGFSLAAAAADLTNAAVATNSATAKPEGIETMRWQQIKDLTVRNSPGLADRKAAALEKETE